MELEETLYRKQILVKEALENLDKARRELEHENAFLCGLIDASGLSGADFVSKQLQDYREKAAIHYAKSHEKMVQSILLADLFGAPAEEGEWLLSEDYFWVDGAFSDDYLIVKTPHLLSRNKSNLRGKNTSLFEQDVFSFLAVNKEKIPDFPKMNISIVTVYAPDAVGMDNDNVDSKGVVDAISSFFPQGDSPKNCSFFLASIFTAMIQEGTYFIVTDSYGAPPKLLWLKRLIEQKWGCKNREKGGRKM